eukprot:gene8206-9767_t
MSSPSVLLSKDSVASLVGINIKWAYTGLGAIKEISLVYFKNESSPTVLSKDIASGVLKYNIPSGFESGQNYTFRLEVVDVNGLQQYSNKLVLQSPYFMLPPVISAIVGKDAAMQVTLASTTNVLSSADTVEFQLVRSDFEIATINKPYSSGRIYLLTSSDSALLVNGLSYSVACDFQPYDDTRYSAQSEMSNTVYVTPSNTPNGTTPSMTSVGTSTLDLRVTWARPSDFADWSSSFSILLTLHDSANINTVIEVPGDVTEYTVQNVARGVQYLPILRYDNNAGLGVEVQGSGYVNPKCVPDAPMYLGVGASDASAVLSWAPPSFNGQSALLGYKVYKNNSQIADLSANLLTYTATGLTNGFSYDFKVLAYNAIGASAFTDVVSASPYTQMTIVSVVASGKTLTITLSPAGNPIEEVTILALDQDPTSGELSSAHVVIPQNQISQSSSGTIQVIKTFSGFSSSIAYWAVMAQNSVSTASQHSSDLAAV